MSLITSTWTDSAAVDGLSTAEQLVSQLQPTLAGSGTNMCWRCHQYRCNWFCHVLNNATPCSNHSTKIRYSNHAYNMVHVCNICVCAEVFVGIKITTEDSYFALDGSKIHHKTETFHKMDVWLLVLHISLKCRSRHYSYTLFSVSVLMHDHLDPVNFATQQFVSCIRCWVLV